MAAAQPHPALHTLSFVTYNLFIGTAVSLGSPKTPLLGSARCERLAPQIEALRALGADALGLQEMHKDALRGAYAAAFAPTHALVSGDFFNLPGLLALLAWRALAAGALLATAAWLLPMQLPPAAWAAAASAALCATHLWLHSGVVAVHFLSGRVHGGLALLLRRGALAARASYTRNFAHQSGDALNLLRPRAFQVCLVEVLPQQQQQQQGPPQLVLIFHTHANLGHGAAGERCRAAQLQEIIDASSPSAVQALLDGAGLGGLVEPAAVPSVLLGDFNAEFRNPSLQASLARGGFLDPCSSAQEPTWDNGNPLTNGVLIEPDARVDLVLYRNPAAAAPLALAPLASTLVLNEAPYYSDHFGVQVLFACTTPPSCTDSSSSSGAQAASAALPALRKGSWESFSSSDSSPREGYNSRSSSCCEEEDLPTEVVETPRATSGGQVKEN